MTARRSRSSGAGPRLRLWGPLLAVVTVVVLLLAWRLRPTTTMAWPDHLDAAALQAWRRSIVWPPLPTVVADVVVAALVVGVASVVDRMVSVRCPARVLRCRWERAARSALNEAPTLRHVRRQGGVVDAMVVLRGGNWAALETALDADKGTMLRRLRLNRQLGSPVRALVHTEGCRNPARARRLRLYYLPLPLPKVFPPWEEPADGAKLFVGHTVDGPLKIDLEEAPHVQVTGDSGTGKGQLIKLFEAQVLRAGWLLMVLDGGASPEFAVLDPAPTVQRPMRLEQSPKERLEAAITGAKLLRAMADARSAITEAFDVERWADIPKDVRAWTPLVGVVIDETTKLLAPSKAKNKELDALRAELAYLLDTDVLRNGRKSGIHVLPLSDQFAYSLVFSRGAQRQASHAIVLGNLAADHVRQVTGLPGGLPAVPDVPRCGHYVRYGNPRIHEIRVPFHPDSLRRAVEYVVAQTGA